MHKLLLGACYAISAPFMFATVLALIKNRRQAVTLAICAAASLVVIVLGYLFGRDLWTASMYAAMIGFAAAILYYVASALVLPLVGLQVIAFIIRRIKEPNRKLVAIGEAAAKVTCDNLLSYVLQFDDLAVLEHAAEMTDVLSLNRMSTDGFILATNGTTYMYAKRRGDKKPQVVHGRIQQISARLSTTEKEAILTHALSSARETLLLKKKLGL